MAVVTMVITAMVICAAACQRPRMATARFIHLPSSGWIATVPLTFEPVYNDSTAPCDLYLALRHDNRYRYRNITLVVDVLGDDAALRRSTLDIPLADEYGNWSSGGFGPLYQVSVPIARHAAPVTARRVVVWQTMAPGDTLTGVVDVGIITRPE